MNFENEFQFEVMGSSALVGKAPAGFDWARYYRTFRRLLMSPRELAVHVWRGYAFTPVWEGSRREENFVSAGHMAFDFDKGDETSSLDFLMREGSFAWMFASFGYATPSSTPASPRSRLVFVLEQPICDAGAYRAAYMAVAWWLAGDGALTDPACKDPLRLYYGSKGGEVRPNWSVLGSATLDYVQEEYQKAFPPRRALQTPLRVVDHAPARGLVEWKRRRIVEAVRGAAPGERHLTLLRRAREAGGYVASGVFEEGEITAQLLDAAADLGEVRPGWAQEAERAVADGLRYGKAKPLHFQGLKPVGELLS